MPSKLLLIASAAMLAFVISPTKAPAQDFEGCTDDCSGHQAGYDWAEQNDITDPDDCGGNSQSFIEGCQTWAEEQQQVDEDDPSGDENDDGADDE